MKIKFFMLPYVSPSDAHDSIEAVAIAEGLQRLGITYYANVDCWFDPIKKANIFTKAPDGYEADVNIYYSAFVFSQYPELVSQIDYSKINILIDSNDELVAFWRDPQFEFFTKFDLLFIDHINSNQPVPPYNIKPFQIGLSQRVLDYNDKYNDSPMDDIILDTFRLHHSTRVRAIKDLSAGLNDKYPTRKIITDNIDDKDVALDQVDKIYWQHTGRRHNPSYFKELNKSLLTYVFGGFYHYKPATTTFIDKFIRRFFMAKAKVQEALGMDSSSNYFVWQWDSYRFWEAMSSNTCPIFFDFESWGFELAVKPVNGVHYIGVKGLDFKSAIEKIRSMSREEIVQIGQAGKKWAIENYGPVPLASRVLGEVEKLDKYKRKNKNS